jgi:hypothetical protein
MSSAVCLDYFWLFLHGLNRFGAWKFHASVGQKGEPQIGNYEKVIGANVPILYLDGTNGPIVPPVMPLSFFPG